MTDKAVLGRKEDEELGHDARLAPPGQLPVASLQLRVTVTLDRRINRSARKWVDLELREIPQWVKKEIQTKGKSVKNPVPWLLSAALAKMRVTKKKHEASGLPSYQR